MAADGCWGPMCEFTGSRTQSDAKPGRCTGEGGYIANAEINELIRSGSAELSHDKDSNTDVLLYDGSPPPLVFVYFCIYRVFILQRPNIPRQHTISPGSVYINPFH